MEEVGIKCKLRVQKHGEVFTPKKTINKMLNENGIKEACENLTVTFLEPSAGEGAFLVAILERKLKMVSEKYNDDLIKYENFSLFALTTLYGIELLEDNAQTCTMNMFQLYYEKYQNQVQYHKGKLNEKVLNSAKKIISCNIRQGNFLTRAAAEGDFLVFSEWTPVNLRNTTKNIVIERTEYTLDEIYNSVEKESGKLISSNIDDSEQLSLFDFYDNNDKIEDEITRDIRYIAVKITDVYKGKRDEFNG